MAANYETVKAEAKRYADEVRSKLPVDRMFLFGSYAKGTADELSDVDIAFFFKDYGGRTRTEIGCDLLRMMHNCKAGIEPLAFPSSELYNDNPFVNEILQTGQEL